MPESKKRKKKGDKGKPTPPRVRTNLPALLQTMAELDRIEEEMILEEFDRIAKELPDAP